MIISQKNIREEAENGFLALIPKLKDQNIFILDRDITVELSDNTIVVLRKGWEYDGASVPYIFQWAFPKFGIYSYNSLIHDICYFNHIKSRKFADKQHFIFGKAIGVKKLDNNIRYVFLRLFGWIYWYKGKYFPTQRAKRNKLFTEIFIN